jgi:hypothetical protein
VPVEFKAVGLAELPSLGETAAEVEVVTRADDDEEDEFVDEPNWEGGTELGSPVASSDDDVDDDDAAAAAGEGEGEGEGEGGE